MLSAVEVQFLFWCLCENAVRETLSFHYSSTETCWTLGAHPGYTIYVWKISTVNRQEFATIQDFLIELLIFRKRMYGKGANP